MSELYMGGSKEKVVMDSSWDWMCVKRRHAKLHVFGRSEEMCRVVIGMLLLGDGG